ncbi:MAG TPA: carboxylesterase family protein [Polyangiaceae bacterium]|nr:carboxylesterase family protein [Polyangiaceae bacterium]
MRHHLIQAAVTTILVTASACGGSDAAEQPPTGTGGGGDAPPCGSVASEPGLVNTEQGPVRGKLDGDVWGYQGIPYAAPPVAELRFRPPTAPACHDGILEANAFGPMCPQVGRDDEGAVIARGDEDCLTLNIWAPENADQRQVLLFIHGGGNVQGSANWEPFPGLSLYHGKDLAEATGAVVVTINYRLGVLGYLKDAALAAESEHGVSGNYGILDQIQALTWVRDNIAGFGGDPERVTIFGQSGGAVDVCVLLASPLAAGLFHGAIMQSGACVSEADSSIDAVSQDAIAALGCEGAPDVAACLRDVPAEDVILSFPLDPETAGSRPDMQAHVDGWVLEATPLETIANEQHHAVPTIVGVNGDETGLGAPQMDQASFEATVLQLAKGSQALASAILDAYPVADYGGSYRDAWIALSSDMQFVCPSREAASTLAAHQQEPVYRYHFTRGFTSPQLASAGAFHGIELFFIFDKLGWGSHKAPEEETALASDVGAYWSAFAGGNLGDVGPVAWPTYDQKTHDYLVLDVPVQAASGGIRTAQCDFWASLGGL